MVIIFIEMGETMEFKRARTDKQKDQRLNQILQVAEALLQKHDYADINMKLIAEHLDYTRGNLYKYYATKEEIFSALFQKQLHLWIEDTLQNFAGAGNLSDTEFATLWSQTIAKYGTMLKIDSLLSTIIETNIDFEKLIEFKSAIINDFYRLLPLVKRQLPFFTEAEAKDFLYFQLLHASALYMNIQARNREQKLLKICDPAYNFIEFIPTFKDYLYTQICGIKTIQAKNKR